LQAFRDGTGDEMDDAGAMLIADALHSLRLVRLYLTGKKQDG
jgi:hypothetical protein